jgi:hypothetical protein
MVARLLQQRWKAAKLSNAAPAAKAGSLLRKKKAVIFGGLFNAPDLIARVEIHLSGRGKFPDRGSQFIFGDDPKLVAID